VVDCAESNPVKKFRRRKATPPKAAAALRRRNPRRSEPVDQRQSATGEPLELTLYLRHRNAVRRPGSAADLRELTRPVSTAELAKERSKLLARPVAQIRRFAKRHRMRVTEVDFLRRRVKLRADAKDAERAFGTRLQEVEIAGTRSRCPAQKPKLPRELAGILHAVLGLDERSRLGLRNHAAANGQGGLYPSEIARLYRIAATRGGAGQCVALIEPSGGYTQEDVVTACHAMNLPVPRIFDINVGTGRNAFGANAAGDEEVSLDVQVIAGVAPQADIAVYFTESNEEGLVAGLVEAIHDDTHRPGVIVITWGEPEVFWPEQARKGLDAALNDALRRGITVVAASGDDLATERMTDGRVHVDYPASSPYVLGCGGTKLELDPAQTSIIDEIVWNDGTRGTGGGISDIYQTPAYQRVITLPPSLNDAKRRRGVPDVAAAAAPVNGYRVVLRGSEIGGSGTSAVAPLWGALIALANAERSRPLGFINSWLYQNRALLKAIVSGNNADLLSQKGYPAGGEWNACTCLGSPGATLVAALTNANTDQVPSLDLMADRSESASASSG
jgi:kumamolisin